MLSIQSFLISSELLLELSITTNLNRFESLDKIDEITSRNFEICGLWVQTTTTAAYIDALAIFLN
jgi:hypothetical protein